MSGAKDGTSPFHRAKEGTSPFHGKRSVGTARVHVADNMEGQTSGGARVSQDVGTTAQQDDQQDSVAELVVSVPAAQSVITVSPLECLDLETKGLRKHAGRKGKSL